MGQHGDLDRRATSLNLRDEGSDIDHLKLIADDPLTWAFLELKMIFNPAADNVPPREMVGIVEVEAFHPVPVGDSTNSSFH